MDFLETFSSLKSMSKRPSLDMSENQRIIVKGAFREFLVSPALISNLNVHKSVGHSHVKC